MAVITRLIFLLLIITSSFDVHSLSFLQKKEHKKEEKQYLPLSIEGKWYIRRTIEKTKGTIFKLENQQLILSCKNKATKHLLWEYPDSELRWKHNSGNFVLQPSRMAFKKESLYIQNLDKMDTGVFTCQVDVSPSRHYIIGVYVLVVGQTVLHALPGNSVNLDCNSKQLGKVFKDAVRFWEINGKPVLNTNDTALNTLKTISNVDQSLTGNWTCNVYTKSQEKVWTTARYRITLSPIPPTMTRVRVFVKNNKVKSVLMLMGFAFAVVVIMNLLIKALERKERAKAKEIEQLKKMLKILPKSRTHF